MIRPPAQYAHWPAFAPDGRTLAVTGDADAVLLFETGTWRVRATLRAPVERAGRGWGGWYPAAWSPDGRLLAVDTWDGRAAVFDVTKMDAVKP